MLGYDADVLELRAGVGEQEVMRVARLPHEKRAGYLKTIVSRRVARVPFRTWVDQLLDAVDDGRVQMLQNGGYPYLFHARGADIKANFAEAASTAISALPEQASWWKPGIRIDLQRPSAVDFQRCVSSSRTAMSFSAAVASLSDSVAPVGDDPSGE